MRKRKFLGRQGWAKPTSEIRRRVDQQKGANCTSEFQAKRHDRPTAVHRPMNEVNSDYIVSAN